MAVYDAVAEHYDASRGGEQRGADFASELDARLPNGTGPVLEVGVGTGVVALGLARLGRSVIGVDVAAAMLLRARARLGGVLVRGDARRLPMGDASVQHAVSVWVVHAEPILHAMFDRASRLHPTWRRNPVTADDILDWGRRAGLEGHVETFESRSWVTTRENEVATINDRAGPALQGLDDDAFRAVTQPAFDALRSLPRGPITRGAQVDIVVLTHPPWGPTISTTVRGGDTVSNRGGEDG